MTECCSRPEHFRSLSKRGEMLSRFGLAFSQPFAWGAAAVDFDVVALSDRKLTLSHLEAVMPGGHVVTVGVHDIEVVSLDLNHFKERLTSTAETVYVTVGGPNESTQVHSANSQETFDPETIYIPKVKHSLSLHIGETPSGKARLPIARIQFVDGSFLLKPYVPPSFTASIDSPVGRISSNISAHIREKAQFLVNRLADPSVEANSPLELKTQAQLQGLVSALPGFEALLLTGASHPYTLFVALCNLAGHIAGIASDPIPPIFPKYKHSDILASFEELSLYVLRTLEQGISEVWDVLPFELVNGIFSLKPDNHWQRSVGNDAEEMARPSLAFGLRFDSDVSKETAVRWGQSARIGTRSIFPSLVERRVLGIERKPINSLEDYYAPKDVTLFALSRDRELLKVGEDLQIDNSSDLKVPLQVLLYSRKPNSIGSRASKGR